MTTVGSDRSATLHEASRQGVSVVSVTEPGQEFSGFDLGPPAPPPAKELYYLASLDGETAGVATVRLSSEADVVLEVAEPQRRTGIGTALLAACAEGAHGSGYSLVYGTATEGTPASTFLDAHGFRTESAVNRLRLNLPAAEAAPSSAVPGFSLRAWAGVPPEELGTALLAAKRNSGDLPSGGLPGVLHDPHKALAMLPKRVRRSGNELHTVAAFDDATRAIVGYAELVVPAEGTQAEQVTTVVLPQYQGRGIGTWLKLATLERIAERCPWVTEIVTENESDNVPMLAINTAVGFELIECTRRRWAYAHSLMP